MDADLSSVQEARDALHRAHEAHKHFKEVDQGTVDRIVDAMVDAGIRESERLGVLAQEETGFGRAESKKEKNLFATRTLRERMKGMKTAGIISKSEDGAVWEVATPMGIVAALIPSTNPTSTAMYKAIIAAKARCGIVMSPHPRAAECTAEACRVVADAAVQAGAPEGLFSCLTNVTIEGTNELLEHDLADVILATGGTAMVRAAYSKGKPAYGVGSGNVPAYVDRSANVEKAASDLMDGTSFDWGTLCSTERSVVADAPIKARLIEAMKREGAHFCSDEERRKLRAVILKKGRLNVDIVGQSPHRIAEMAGFSVPEDAKALVAETDMVGKEEPVSIETLSPILSFYTADGWQKGCERCIEILELGGIGHTLAIHAANERVIERFALEKPAMRIVVNTNAALGSVGLTTSLFPAMTLGPGTIGGSITSDNISPMHLLNVKRLAFETHPLDDSTTSRQTAERPSPWIDEIDERLRARAGNPSRTPRRANGQRPVAPGKNNPGPPLPEARISELVSRFKK